MKLFKEQISIEKEIENLNKRIERLQDEESIVTDSVKGSSAEFPYTEHSIVIKGINEIRNAKINKLKMIIAEYKNKLEEKKIDIELEIENVGDSILRQILRYKYLDKLKWKQIQIKMNYGSESTARMIHDRYFKKK